MRDSAGVWSPTALSRLRTARNAGSPPTSPKLDGEAEAKLTAMRPGRPPAGYGHWILRLLADELAALEVVASISHETVRKTLKKWRDPA